MTMDMAWRRVRLPAKQRANTPCSSDGRTSAPRDPKVHQSCHACSQPTAVIWTRWTTASGAWCRSKCTRLQSVTWSSYDSGWLSYDVTSNKPWWTTPLTSGEHDSKLMSLFRQTVVISNSACDVVCGTIFHHSTTGSFQSDPTITGSFQSHPLFPEENNINFD